MKRPQLIKLHIVLAAILLPAIAMFSITGGLYTWGIKGGYNSQTFKLPLADPLKSDLGSLISFTQTELDKQQQTYPSGAVKLKSTQHTHILEWTGSQLDVRLDTDKGSKLAELTIKHTSPYRHLVQLHKGKGGTLFKIYAAFMAFSLLIILVSGVLMGLGLPKYRNLTMATLAAGTVLWLLMVAWS